MPPKRNRLLETAESVLRKEGRAMRVAEIDAAAREILGRELHPSSIKGALSANVNSRQPRFHRIRRGVYELTT